MTWASHVAFDHIFPTAVWACVKIFTEGLVEETLLDAVVWSEKWQMDNNLKYINIYYESKLTYLYRYLGKLFRCPDFRWDIRDRWHFHAGSMIGQAHDSMGNRLDFLRYKFIRQKKK